MKVVIMAGGRGTRISELFPDIPKPLIPIEGVPVLERELVSLRNQGFKDFIMTVSYMGDKIMNYFGDGSKLGVSIQYYNEVTPLGNAGALFKLREQLGDEPFLLLNADAVFDVDFNRMVRFHQEHGGLVTLFTHPNNHPYDSGLIIAEKNMSVQSWLAKEDVRPIYYKNRVNAGLHVIDPKILDMVSIDADKIGTVDETTGKTVKVDLDRQLLKPLAGSGKMFCYDSPEYVKDMGTPARFHQVEEDFKAGRVWDDHSQWGKYEEDDTPRDVWVKRFEDAAEAIKIRDPSNARGLLPAFAERILKELKKSQTDWRTILNDFIQEEVVDYSFAPPDRRFDDSPFFLPDFNGKEDRVEDILFMIDTSGSMSDDMIAAAYSEVKGAIDQFNGKLKGWLGFFDAAIIKPQPFSDENEFKIIKPAGGGGTDFQIIFEYVFHHMSDKLPASIIILSDGYAPFPLEKLAGGIPVLWLLNNEEVNPPWGKVARITV